MEHVQKNEQDLCLEDSTVQTGSKSERDKKSNSPDSIARLKIITPYGGLIEFWNTGSSVGGFTHGTIDLCSLRDLI